MSQGPLERGDRLGRYEIRQLIGEGGMGRVYRAWDTMLNRDVALKTLGTPDSELLARLAREADAIGRLSNPNVVCMYEFHADPKQPYIVMEYLRGEDVSSRLDRGRMDLAEATEMILGVCSAVHACHGLGIIHRDIKPANVFLHQTPEFGTVVKVLDFGVAMLNQEIADDITRPGHIVGTPRYLAPEQVEHLEVDARLDQYGIGLLLYTVFAGRSPYFHLRNEAALIKAIMREQYARLGEVRPELPPDLRDAVERSMSLDRGLRFPSVLDLGKAIAACAPNKDRIPPEFLPPADQPIDDLSNTKVDRPIAELRIEQNAANVAAPEIDTLDGGESRPVSGGAVVPIVQFRAVPVVSTTALLPTDAASSRPGSPGRRVVEKTALLDEERQEHWHVDRAALPAHPRPIHQRDAVLAAESEDRRRKVLLILLAGAVAALIGIAIAILI